MKLRTQSGQTSSRDVAACKSAIHSLARFSSLQRFSFTWNTVHATFFQDLEPLGALQFLRVELVPVARQRVMALLPSPVLWNRLRELRVLGSVSITLPVRAYMQMRLEAAKLERLIWSDTFNTPSSSNATTLLVNAKREYEEWLVAFHRSELATCQSTL